MNPPDELVVGLVSISDRASAGIYADQGLPGLTAWFEAALSTPWRFETRLIPDEQPLIEQTLIDLVDTVDCHLVLTNGGTGPALSRQVGVVRGRALILNLPGQPKAIKETLDGIFPAVPYCLDLIGGPYVETNDDVCKVFRPKSAIRKK